MQDNAAGAEEQPAITIVTGSSMHSILIAAFLNVAGFILLVFLVKQMVNGSDGLKKKTEESSEKKTEESSEKKTGKIRRINRSVNEKHVREEVVEMSSSTLPKHDFKPFTDFSPVPLPLHRPTPVCRDTK